MPKFLKNGSIVGYLVIGGKRYELLQMNLAVWIVNPDNDKSIRKQFKNREKLLAAYPGAVFNYKEN